MTQAPNLLDRAGAVRGGEELDAGRVDAFLKARIAGLEGAPEIRQFSRGASNLTYLLSYPGRDLVLRRPPFGHKAKGAHDMLREARVMAALEPVYPVVPAVLATCDDPAVMGCDFYVMDRIAGIIPRQDLPAGLGFGEAETRRLCVERGRQAGGAAFDPLAPTSLPETAPHPRPFSQAREGRTLLPSPSGRGAGVRAPFAGQGRGLRRSGRWRAGAGASATRAPTT